MRERIDDRDVGARAQLQMLTRLDVRCTHKIDAARIDDDELGALTQTPLHARGKHRMAVGRVRTDASVEHGLAFWVVSDNVRKGAATNAVQIAELLVDMDLVHGAHHDA